MESIQHSRFRYGHPSESPRALASPCSSQWPSSREDPLRWGYVFHAFRGLMTPFGLLMVLQTLRPETTGGQQVVVDGRMMTGGKIEVWMIGN